eukprot:scaffold60459_cov31-Tisochrysis_lutea.AAC.9
MRVAPAPPTSTCEEAREALAALLLPRQLEQAGEAVGMDPEVARAPTHFAEGEGASKGDPATSPSARRSASRDVSIGSCS